jgi:hypothetical protein
MLDVALAPGACISTMAGPLQGSPRRRCAGRCRRPPAGRSAACQSPLWGDPARQAASDTADIICDVTAVQSACLCDLLIELQMEQGCPLPAYCTDLIHMQQNRRGLWQFEVSGACCYPPARSAAWQPSRRRRHAAARPPPLRPPGPCGRNYRAAVTSCFQLQVLVPCRRPLTGTSRPWQLLTRWPAALATSCRADMGAPCSKAPADLPTCCTPGPGG